MKTALDAEGRDGSDFTLAFITNMFVAPGDGKAQDGGRMIFTGSDDNIRSDIQALSDLGVKHLMVNLQTGSMDETLDNMSRFASDIMPAGGN